MTVNTSFGQWNKLFGTGPSRESGNRHVDQAPVPVISVARSQLTPPPRPPPANPPRSTTQHSTHELTQLSSAHSPPAAAARPPTRPLIPPLVHLQLTPNRPPDSHAFTQLSSAHSPARGRTDAHDPLPCLPQSGKWWPQKERRGT